MSTKTTQDAQFVNQLAGMAHQFIDQLQTRAVDLEVDLGKQSQASTERVFAGIEGGTATLQKYIAENPMMAAAVAFGIGMFATRIFNSDGTPSIEATVSEDDESMSEAA